MNKMQIRKMLSVIVVTYKQPEYIYQTIDSILAQDYSEIEIVIADDGTPDFSIESINDYITLKKKDNLKMFTVLYDGKNRGTVKNINRALDICHGEYIKIIGGDDTYYSTDVFSSEINILDNSGTLLGVISKTQQCDAFMSPIYDYRVEKSNQNISCVLEMNYDQARRYINKMDIFPIAVQAICFRRDFFNEMGYCDEDYIVIDDSPTILKVLKRSKNFSHLDKYTVKHRSDVGISTSKELFSPRRLIYYLDCVTYGKKEIKPNPHVYGVLYSLFTPYVNTFVYKMALSKKEKKGTVNRLLLACEYFIPLSYYFLHNSKKVIFRIRKAAGKNL